MNWLRERYQAFSEWQPPDDHWLPNLLKDSRIPAIKEAAKPGISIYARLFWIGIFFICIGLAIVLVKVALLLYFNFPLLFAFHSKRVRVEDIRIGTAAVCPSESLALEQIQTAINMLKVAESTGIVIYKGEEWTFERTVRLLYLLEHVCLAKSGPSSVYDMVGDDKIETALKNINDQLDSKAIDFYDDPEDEEMQNHLIPFLKEAMVNCEELLVYCTYGMTIYDCKDLFQLVVTDVGGCCLFNSIQEQALKKHRTALSLIQGSNETLVEQWKSIDADKHVLVGTNRSDTDNPLEFPITQKFGGTPFGLSFVVKSLKGERTCKQFEGTGHMIAFYPTHDDAQIRPISLQIPPNHVVQIGLYPDVELAQDDVRAYSPDVRDCCYAKDSHPKCQLAYYHEYTETNCLSECLANTTRTECGCSVLSMPKEPGAVLCNPSQLACVKKVQFDAAKKGISQMCPQCLPNCNSLKIRTVVTLTPISKESPPDLVAELFRNNISASIVSTYYVDNWYLVKEMFERFGWIEITVIVLGLFGTTNGFSFIDVARISTAIVKAVKTCSDKVKVAYNAVFSLLGMINIVTDLVVPGVRPLDLALAVLARKESEEKEQQTTENNENTQDESNSHENEDPIDPGEMRETTPVLPFDEEEEEEDEEDNEEIKAVEMDEDSEGKEKKEKVDGNVGWTALSAGLTASCVAIGRETWDECFEDAVETSPPNENEDAKEDPEVIPQSKDEEEHELESIEPNEQPEAAERERSGGELGAVSNGFIQAGKVGAAPAWIVNNQADDQVVANTDTSEAELNNVANADAVGERGICNAKLASAKIDAKKEDVKAKEKFVITGTVGRNCASVGYMFACVVLGRENLYECNDDEHMDGLDDSVQGPDPPEDSDIPFGERPDPGDNNLEIGESEPGPSHGVRCPWSRQQPDIENQMDDESSDEEFENLWGNKLFVDELAKLQARRRGLKTQQTMVHRTDVENWYIRQFSLFNIIRRQ